MRKMKLAFIVRTILRQAREVALPSRERDMSTERHRNAHGTASINEE